MNQEILEKSPLSVKKRKIEENKMIWKEKLNHTKNYQWIRLVGNRGTELIGTEGHSSLIPQTKLPETISS